LSESINLEQCGDEERDVDQHRLTLPGFLESLGRWRHRRPSIDRAIPINICRLLATPSTWVSIKTYVSAPSVGRRNHAGATASIFGNISGYKNPARWLLRTQAWCGVGGDSLKGIRSQDDIRTKEITTVAGLFEKELVFYCDRGWSLLVLNHSLVGLL
jgi:hypothetical protein